MPVEIVKVEGRYVCMDRWWGSFKATLLPPSLVLNIHVYIYLDPYVNDANIEENMSRFFPWTHQGIFCWFSLDHLNMRKNWRIIEKTDEAWIFPRFTSHGPKGGLIRYYTQRLAGIENRGLVLVILPCAQASSLTTLPSGAHRECTLWGGKESRYIKSFERWKFTCCFIPCRKWEICPVIQNIVSVG